MKNYFGWMTMTFGPRPRHFRPFYEISYYFPVQFLWNFVDNTKNLTELVRIHILLQVTPKKIIQWGEVWNLGGQYGLPKWEMTWPGNFVCNNSVVSQAVWHVALSCGNHESISTSSSLSPMTIIEPKITVHHFSIALTVHCNSISTGTFKKYGPITLRYQNPHHKVTCCGCITFSWITWFTWIWSLQMRQFCLFTNPFRWKWASSVNIIFFEKSPSFWLFSNKKDAV